MKHVLLLLVIVLNMPHIYAQVTIGSDSAPAKAALLELKDKNVNNPTSVTHDSNISSTTGGLSLPRVKLVNKATLEPFIPLDDSDWLSAPTSKIKEVHAGLMVYNIETSNGFEQGIYVWDGAQWIKSGAAGSVSEPKFFYMPSFNLPINTLETTAFGIYDEYQTQFTKAGLHVYEPDEIEFKVTYYDSSLIDNIEFPESAENRFMVYDVLSTTAPEGAYLNIIIVVK